MVILIVGSEENEHECREKFGGGHSYQRIELNELGKKLQPGSIVFDFEPRDVSVYTGKGAIIFLNAATTTLARLTSDQKNNSSVFGFCGLPTFLDREILEVSILTEGSKTQLARICKELNTNYKIVEDKVGMITPRIVSMIINEAYFAIEGDVASRKDIDLAMKLGTNYPFGPFEWCERIGITNVCRLLKAVYEDSKDERYKVCSLLEREASSFPTKSR